MHTTAIENSPDVKAACGRFLDEIGAWVGACIERYRGEPPTDGHDQGTFTTGWEPYIRARGDEEALPFMKAMRDKIAQHFTATGKWQHGYWMMQEAHHGTEHYELFLGCLWRLDPSDGETVRQLVDAAEHLGNWSPEVPAWFDWERGVYHSMYFGAAGLQIKDGAELNVPDHFRCVNIALLAHRMTGEARYTDLAARHAGRWADAILAGDELPIGLAGEAAVYALAGDAKRAYHGFAGQLGDLAQRVDRAENFLASGAVNALLDLGELTGQAPFRQAAERLLDIIATQLADADAGPAAAAIGAYRRRTGSDRYDQKVRDAAEKLQPYAFSALAIEPRPQRERREPGIGKRADMPCWFEDAKPRRHNPILLALAAEIADDEPLAARAVDLARAYFALARQLYPDGREHGCSARSLSAIARGHGRDNNAGMTTAVLAPLMQAFAPT